MNNSDYSDLDAEIIDVTPKRKRGGRGRIKWIILAAIFLLFVALLGGVGLYTESLWFDSLGFASRFWSVFRLGWILFAVFGAATFLILGGGFYALERFFGLDKLTPQRIIINKQPVEIYPSRYVKKLGWILAIVFAVSYAFGLSGDWQSWTLFLPIALVAAALILFLNALSFILSNMPIEGNADLKITRPKIYFGERTDTDVYVKTKQREFE